MYRNIYVVLFSLIIQLVKLVYYWYDHYYYWNSSITEVILSSRVHECVFGDAVFPGV